MEDNCKGYDLTWRLEMVSVIRFKIALVDYFILAVVDIF